LLQLSRGVREIPLYFSLERYRTMNKEIITWDVTIVGPARPFTGVIIKTFGLYIDLGTSNVFRYVKSFIKVTRSIGKSVQTLQWSPFITQNILQVRECLGDVGVGSKISLSCEKAGASDNASHCLAGRLYFT